MCRVTYGQILNYVECTVDCGIQVPLQWGRGCFLPSTNGAACNGATHFCTSSTASHCHTLMIPQLSSWQTNEVPINTELFLVLPGSAINQQAFLAALKTEFTLRIGLFIFFPPLLNPLSLSLPFYIPLSLMPSLSALIPSSSIPPQHLKLCPNWPICLPQLWQHVTRPACEAWQSQQCHTWQGFYTVCTAWYASRLAPVVESFSHTNSAILNAQ